MNPTAIPFSPRRVFVTVGSTKFDDLVQSILSDPLIEVLRARGCKHLVVQVGNSQVPTQWLDRPLVQDLGTITVEWWRFKPDLSEEVAKADLIISHAGSGTILDVLREGKVLIVVPNNTLLDNHQEELALAMSEQGYLISATISTLGEAIVQSKAKEMVPFPPFDGDKFRRIIDEEMGFI